MSTEKSFLRFLGIIILFAILTGSLAVFIIHRYSFPQKPSLNSILGLCVFFVFTTSLVYSMVSVSITKKPTKMVIYFMGATTIKLFLSLLFLAIYAMTHAGAAKGFIVVFFIFYMLFTAFEVAALILKVKRPESGT